MKRAALFLCVIMVCAGTGWAQDSVLEQKSEKPYERLLDFFDQNERAVAYHRLCVGAEKFPPPQFMDNMNYVSAQLQSALQKVHPDKTSQEIEEYLLKRGGYLQRKNTQIAYDQGCYGAWATVAKKHYDLFSNMKTEIVADFIENRIKR